jgi:hypothetical protein
MDSEDGSLRISFIGNWLLLIMDSEFSVGSLEKFEGQLGFAF